MTPTHPNTPQTLELLAPAKDKAQGMEAIRHGADAVYIGAPAYGARAAVPVSVDDIRELADFAHLYQARVYAALNTILRDEELPRAVELAHKLYNAGVDALIIQDLGLLTQELPPIALHGSTQMDNVAADRVSFLAGQGFEQVVLARELSPAQISRIHREVPNIRLEAFVHGALCVSYSGRCYAAAAFHGRSANRGSCSQVCRLPYDLIDGKGMTIAHDKHLLSIKDMNRSEVLGQFIEAGVRSFKIEGRLKDVTYVKNVTLAYHELLNAYIAEHPEYTRSSIGRVEASFHPDLTKVFNRGYTSFTHKGRGEDDLEAFRTPKSIGPVIGRVKNIDGVKVTLDLLSGVELSNGDGFTFMTPEEKTMGFRANTADGNKIVLPRPVPDLKVGMTIYRSNDRQFERIMSGKTAQRKVPIAWTLTYSDQEMKLTGSIPSLGVSTSVDQSIELEEAKKGNTLESIQGVLNKLGNTPFESIGIDVSDAVRPLFIPRSILTQMRQDATQSLEAMLRDHALATRGVRTSETADDSMPYWTSEVDYTGNVFNTSAKRFLESHGAQIRQMAFEYAPRRDMPVMYTKHCIRYSLHQCPHLQGYKGVHHDPWILESTLPDDTNPVRMRIEFDCKNCQMKLYEVT